LNPPGGQSGQHPSGSQFSVGTQIPAGGKPLAGGKNLIMGQPFTGSQVIGPSWNLGTQQHPGGKATLVGPSGGGTHHTGPSNPVFPGLNPGKTFPGTTQAGPSNPVFPGLNPGKPFPGTVNPTWSQPVQMGIHPQGGMPSQQVNPAYMSQNPQQQPAIGSIYNAPLQDAYGPTGIPTDFLLKVTSILKLTDNFHF
jgi:hypothetical protein